MSKSWEIYESDYKYRSLVDPDGEYADCEDCQEYRGEDLCEAHEEGSANAHIFKKALEAKTLTKNCYNEIHVNGFDWNAEIDNLSMELDLSRPFGIKRAIDQIAQLPVLNEGRSDCIRCYQPLTPLFMSSKTNWCPNCEGTIKQKIERWESLNVELKALEKDIVKK